ncbi:MAG: hypothetical protein SFV32_09995 [Opitutaceae bacterium]|nr:hypothetical protein [Opitutaceae bacterium]
MNASDSGLGKEVEYMPGEVISPGKAFGGVDHLPESGLMAEHHVSIKLEEPPVLAALPLDVPIESRVSLPVWEVGDLKMVKVLKILVSERLEANGAFVFAA